MTQQVNTEQVPQQLSSLKTKTFTYKSAGQDIALTYNTVVNYLTKGKGVSDTDVLQFISICKYQELNPFLNEAYLVKFGTAPA